MTIETFDPKEFFNADNCAFIKITYDLPNEQFLFKLYSPIQHDAPMDQQRIITLATGMIGCVLHNSMEIYNLGRLMGQQQMQLSKDDQQLLECEPEGTA